MPNPKPLIILTLLLSPAARGAADDDTMKPTASTSDDEMMMTSSPSTKPGPATRATPSRGGARSDVPILERLREHAGRLDLSESQQQQLKELADATRDKIRREFREAGGDRDKARARVQEVTRDAMERVRAILNPEQQRKLRQILAGGAAATPEMRDDMTSQAPVTDAPAKDKKSNPISTDPVDPATLRLTKLDGKTLNLQTLKGKPIVLVFGSWSCPSFRDHVKDLDTLARQYALKAHFVTIYTREAHPTGGWEVQRNKDLQLAIPAHENDEDRLTQAKQMRSKTGLSTTIAVDTMDDQAVRAFGTELFPNGVVILDRDGTCAAKQRWFEPRRLRALLDQITNVPGAQSSTKPTK